MRDLPELLGHGSANDSRSSIPSGINLDLIRRIAALELQVNRLELERDTACIAKERAQIQITLLEARLSNMAFARDRAIIERDEARLAEARAHERYAKLRAEVNLRAGYVPEPKTTPAPASKPKRPRAAKPKPDPATPEMLLAKLRAAALRYFRSEEEADASMPVAQARPALSK